MKKNRSNRFWKIYGCVTGAAMILIAVGLVVFSDFIAAYELAQPATAASRYASSISEKKFENMLEDAVTEAPSVFDSIESAICAYLEAVPEGTYSCKRILNLGNTQNPVYGLYCDGLLLAHVTLDQNPPDKYGFRSWHVEKTEILIENLPITRETFEIYVPTDSVVTVNGVSVSEEYILEREALYPFRTAFEQDRNVYCTVYEIQDVLGVPTVLCERNGTVCTAADLDTENALCFLYPETDTHSYDIVVPEGSTVTVNGISLEDSYTSETEIPYEYHVMEASCENLPTAKKYTVAGLFLQPEVKVAYGGMELTAAWNEDGSVCTANYPEEMKYSCVITVPAGGVVTMRGMDCSPYKTEETVSPYTMLFEELGAAPQLELYQIDGLYIPPEDVSLTYNGTALDIAAAQNGYIWSFDGEYPAVMNEDAKNLALTFIQAYFYYTSQGYNNTYANMQNAIQYVASWTELYNRILNSTNGFSWTTPVTSFVYNVLEMTKMQEIAPGEYVCTIDFDVDQMIYHVSRDYSGTVTLYIAGSGAGMKVYGMVIDNN